MDDKNQRLSLTRRRFMKLVGALAGFVAGTSVFGTSATAKDPRKRPHATPQQVARGIAALAGDRRFAAIQKALATEGFTLTPADRVAAVIERTGTKTGVLITFRAPASDSSHAAFAAVLVDEPTGSVRDVNGTLFKVTEQGRGLLTVVNSSPIGEISTESSTVELDSSCPKGMDCTQDDWWACRNTGPWCCGSWYQIQYYYCSGCYLFRCTELEQFCCCCSNAERCWYTRTGQSCSLYGSCQPPDGCPCDNGCCGCA